VGYVFIARSVTRRTLMFFFLTRRFCVCFYSVETFVLYNVCETFVKIRMKFSPRKVVFLLSLFQTFTAKKNLCAVFPSGSVWHSFTKFPKQLLCWNTGILHTSLTVAFVALSVVTDLTESWSLRFLSSLRLDPSLLCTHTKHKRKALSLLFRGTASFSTRLREQNEVLQTAQRKGAFIWLLADSSLLFHVGC
jgi:hypothetical protein